MAGALEIAKRALDELGFFSKALEEAKGAKMKSGTPQQWMNVLQKQGVKPAELEATGFTNMLAAQPDAKLAKDDVVKFLTDNRVKLAEPSTAPSGDIKANWAAIEAAKARRNELAQQISDAAGGPDHERLRSQYADVDRQLDDLIDQRSRMSWSEPKFERYSLPGGANYAESRLQLMPKPEDLSDELVLRIARQQYEDTAGPASKPWDEITDGARDFAINRTRDWLQRSRQPLYRSSHWDEPDVLAHYRTKDRLGPNGERVLHVDEIQSDWAQTGRDKGFRDPKAQERLAELGNKSLVATGRYRDAVRRHNELLASPGSPEEQALSLEVARADRELNEINREYGLLKSSMKYDAINPGPFVTNTKDWTDLTLKRALLKAQREGYDAIALTPGAEQADRYDMSKQVGRVYYNPESGRLEVNAPETWEGRQGDMLHEGTYRPEELPGVIGRENAARLLQAPTTHSGYHKLEPDGMTWGGEGMKAFYDRIAPERLNALARKLDPEAKLETMPAGRRLGLDWGDGDRKSQTRRVYAQTDMADAQAGNIDTFSREFPTLDEAEDYIQANHWPRGGEIPQLPMLRLTPRMKEQLAQGLPLFVGAPAVAGGALSVLDRQTAPPANEFARGGLAQARREQERFASRAGTRPEDRYLDDLPTRGLVPNYDAIVAGRPVGGDGLSEYLQENGGRLRGFADGGEAEYDGPGGGYEGSTQQGIDAYNGSQNTFDANQSYSEWAGSQGQNYDSSGNYIGGGYITDPNDPAAQYNPGDINFNTEQSYNDWAATEGQNYDALGNYVGGSEPTGSAPVGGFGMFGAELGAPLSAGLPGIGMSVPSVSMPEAAAKAGAPTSGVSFDESGIPSSPVDNTLAGLAMPLDAPYASLPDDDPRDPYADVMGPVSAARFGIEGPVGVDAPAPSMAGVPGTIGPQATVPNGPAMGWEDPAPDVRGMPSMTAFGPTPYGGGALGPMSQKDAFLADFMPGAVGASRATGIESRIIGAQGAHESAWGRSPSGQNNQLGMKGPGTQVATHEYVNGQRVNMTDSFRDFASPSKQFEFYSELMNRPAFADIGKQKTYEGQIEALDDSPYATDPRYGDKVDRIASSINPGLYDLAIRDIGSNYGAMGRAMRENAVPEYGPGASVGAAPASMPPSDMTSLMGYAPQSGAIPDVIGAQMKSSPDAPTQSTMPSYGHEFHEPNQIGYGLGFSPFGAAGTPAFGAAMGSINPQLGGMLGATPSGLPSFVAQDMAQQALPGVFGQPTVHEYYGPPQPVGDTIDGRPVEEYGFAGPAVAANGRGRAPAFDGPPIDVQTLPEPAPLPPERPADLEAPEDGPVASPRSPSMNERVAGAMGQTANRRDIDPLTRQVYDPVTGYTYPVDPLTMGKIVDGVVGVGVPVLGQLNGLSRLFGGPSVGGVMGYGVPGGWDKLTPADGSDRAFGNAGLDSRDAQYLAPSKPSAPPPTSTVAADSNAAMMDYLRRKYLGEDDDPKTYGMRAQRRYYEYG